MLKVQTRNLGNVSVLSLQGRIVKSETASLRQAIDFQSEASALVLDLARVSAIDASGLGLLLVLRRQSEARGVRFRLMNATKFVSRVLEITHLDSVFEVVPRDEPAVQRARAARVEFAACA